MDHQKCKPSQSCCNQFTYQERIMPFTKSPKGTLFPAKRLKKKKIRPANHYPHRNKKMYVFRKDQPLKCPTASGALKVYSRTLILVREMLRLRNPKTEEIRFNGLVTQVRRAGSLQVTGLPRARGAKGHLPARERHTLAVSTMDAANTPTFIFYPPGTFLELKKN